MSPDFHLGADGLLRCSALDRVPGQTHAFGTRLAMPEAAVTLRQVHSSQVHSAAGLADREQPGDGLVSAHPGTAIGVRTADCVPLLLFDPQTRSAAAVHAGWRGTAAGIANRALDALAREFGTRPHDVFAAIGPSIGVCCYRVSPDVSSLFEPWEAVHAGHVDLPAANSHQLIDAGVPDAQIFVAGLCTACLPELFFCYRRDPADPGRMLSIISVV